MRSLSVLLFAAVASLTASAQVLGFDGEESATVGIYIREIETGRMVAEHNAAQAMVPASTMKSLTAATALSVLGEDFHFVTPVELSGTRQG
ncbi:MAG: D-alanyl-D-alanine carboxypeptidase, partial [Muribaculaceae bacterium]|nr:D-alanyl-D-alanine carboxypeptidase [Muribaculaceae bacterium]